jgi:hypothetical protein
MENLNRIENISLEIKKLEVEQHLAFIELKNQVNFTLATLSPSNFLKTTLQDAIALPDLQDGIVNNAIGLATGFLSKKILIGSTHNPIKKVLGSIFQLVVTSYISKHSNAIKNVSESIINKVFNKQK